ncbi:formylglycine-generating enzyme family protein [Anatilimnocola sp. NA78]|uniref:formylglycine-generating enzyme family protein n=1 Tax=Anatilimnocola sp. NA78 TaxID=3415683 RepID=UPI003CE5412B
MLISLPPAITILLAALPLTRYVITPTMHTRCASLSLVVVLAVLANLASGQEAKPKVDVVTNSLGIKLALIPAGEFQMGSHESLKEIERAFPGNEYESKLERKILDADEWPQHKVRITKPFRLGVHEVTVGQFRQYAKESGNKTEAEADGTGGWGINKQTGKYEGRKPEYNWQNPGYAITDNHPAVNISWNDATAFCKWLSEKEKKKYRLPTEAEWEYACRAGTKTRFFTGNDPESLSKHSNLADKSSIAEGKKEFHDYDRFALKSSDGHFTPAPVGSFEPNAFGLYDMHANVWEWCQDLYDENYYGKSPAEDPKGPTEGKLHVRRGGAFHTFPIYVRSSFRNWNTPYTRYLNLGFRVACEE